MTCEEQLKQVQEQLRQTEEINNNIGTALIRIKVHCAVMNDKLAGYEKEGKDVSLVRQLITQVLTEIGA